MLIFIPNFKRSFNRIPPLNLKSMPLNLAHTQHFCCKKTLGGLTDIYFKTVYCWHTKFTVTGKLRYHEYTQFKGTHCDSLVNFSKDSMIVLNVLSKSSTTISRSKYFWNSSLILLLSSNAFRISSSWKYFFVNHCYWICIRTHLHSLHTFTKLCIKIGKQCEIYFT